MSVLAVRMQNYYIEHILRIYNKSSYMPGYFNHFYMTGCF